MNDIDRQELIGAALRQLGIERLTLTLHESAFPDAPQEDVGRGNPGSTGAREVLAYAAAEGFDCIQLGPQGKLSAVNASPYDGALFARSPHSISLGRLVTLGLLRPSELDAFVAARPPGPETRTQYTYAWHVYERALRLSHTRFAAQPDAPAKTAAFHDRHHDWLETAVLFDVLASLHGTENWRHWISLESGIDRDLFLLPAEVRRRRTEDLLSTYGAEVDFHVFCQLLAHREHEVLRQYASGLGLELLADFQIGISNRDTWYLRPLFLPGYALGAPPSRTNPLGQPWEYPVVNPDTFGSLLSPGPGLLFFRQRFEKQFTEYDGIRFDHPHGLVCPWVYHSPTPVPTQSVRSGARLFSSPDLAEHPSLAALSIARREQLAPDDHPRHADDWVRELTAEQVERYAIVMDLAFETARAHGRDRRHLAAEVLSTCPMPLARVLERHGLGRFRVTQKSNLSDVNDPYRTDAAFEQDWVMVGTHDTPPLCRVLPTWSAQLRRDWGHYLAARLYPGAATADKAQALAADDASLARALFADLFVGPARYVQVFFADWLGIDVIYNRPGVVDEDNWMLRLPRDFRSFHDKRRAEGMGLDVAGAVATALRARAGGSSGDASDLAVALAQHATRNEDG